MYAFIYLSYLPHPNLTYKVLSVSYVPTDVHPFIKHKEENSLESQELSKRARPGQSCSDAEIDYRRARSLREATGILAWRNSLP